MAFQSAQNKALIDLLKTDDYSDLTITCGKDQYRVHKAIICPRSKFFKAACDGKFKEAQTGTIDLPDDDPVAVRMMIDYLYRDTYLPTGVIHRDGSIDAHLSDTEYDEQEKQEMELYGATFAGNKRVKRLTTLPEVSIAPVSHPLPLPFGSTVLPPPPPPAASQESGTGRGQSQRGPGSFGGFGSTPTQNRFQGSPNQSSSTPSSFSLGSPAPAPTPPPPQQPSAPQRSIPAENLHLHAKVYALGEKYGIPGLKALAAHNFETRCEDVFSSNSVHRLGDLIHQMREAYACSAEGDRPLREAVVRILKLKPIIFEREDMKEFLKEEGLAYDMVMSCVQDILKRGGDDWSQVV
ncbi:hypothetical protein FBULB1_9087 [Fusarium bulbicola]|nr:hypothetical protein FBULB1_9087 [Fusarium bulbicola]